MMIDMKNNSLKYIERLITKEEMRKLLGGRRIIIAEFIHHFKKYELRGYLVEIKKESRPLGKARK
jgi:hypothetical protein